MTVRRATWCQVRRLDSRQLHAVAGRMLREFRESELTAGQERYLDQCLQELEWRSARKRRGYTWCSCWMCAVAEEPF